jgi:hypothetical protein
MILDWGGQDLRLGTDMILGWRWTGSGTRNRHDLLKVDRI